MKRLEEMYEYGISNCREENGVYKADVKGVVFIMPYPANTIAKMDEENLILAKEHFESFGVEGDLDEDSLFIPCWFGATPEGEGNLGAHTLWTKIENDPEKSLGIALRNTYWFGVPEQLFDGIKEGDKVKFTLRKKLNLVGPEDARNNYPEDRIAVPAEIRCSFVADQLNTRYYQYGPFEDMLQICKAHYEEPEYGASLM